MHFPLLTSKLFFYKLWASLNLHLHTTSVGISKPFPKLQVNTTNVRQTYIPIRFQSSLSFRCILYKQVLMFTRNSGFLSIQYSHIIPHLEVFPANVDILHKKTQNRCTSCLCASNPKLLVNHMTVCIFTQFYFCITFFSQGFSFSLSVSSRPFSYMLTRTSFRRQHCPHTVRTAFVYYHSPTLTFSSSYKHHGILEETQ